MSSTNRGKEVKNHDYFITPHWAIREFFKEFIKSRLFGGIILDPCAGGDEINPMSYPTVLNEFQYNCRTIDIRKDSKASVIGDYLKIDCKDKYDVIISNPPFSLATEFISKALNDVKPDGFVIMLCKLNLFGSDKRFEFWKGNMPKYTYVHHRRMSFTGDGKTDSIEYAHLVWKKGYRPEYTALKVI